MSLSAASRVLASSASRRLRVANVSRISARFRLATAVVCQRRSLFNFGKSKPDSPPDEMEKADLEVKARELRDRLLESGELRNLLTHPGAAQAIQNLLSILTKKGINVENGQPKLADMMRLAADKEFREAILTFKAEAAKAGVNMDDPNLVQSLMKMAASPKPKP